MASGSGVAVHPDPESLALAAATLIVEEASRAVSARGRFALALSGGSTPKRTYELLSRPPFVDRMPWECVDVFWGDERCVAPADPRSNELMARHALLNYVPIPPDQVHPMRCQGVGTASGRPGESHSEDLARRSADEYEGLLRAFFPEQTETALDVVLLGLGANGHTASLFPESEVLPETVRWVAAAFDAAAAGGAVPDGAGPASTPSAAGTAVAAGLWRITLTASFINRAASVLFLVSGSSKAGVVKEVLEGPINPTRLPAELIHPENGTLRWYLDEDSAALLSAPSRKELE
jgi:6-phosphogluconolactonase